MFHCNYNVAIDHNAKTQELLFNFAKLQEFSINLYCFGKRGPIGTKLGSFTFKTGQFNG